MHGKTFMSMIILTLVLSLAIVMPLSATPDATKTTKKDCQTACSKMDPAKCAKAMKACGKAPAKCDKAIKCQKAQKDCCKGDAAKCCKKDGKDCCKKTAATKKCCPKCQKKCDKNAKKAA